MRSAEIEKSEKSKAPKVKNTLNSKDLPPTDLTKLKNQKQEISNKLHLLEQATFQNALYKVSNHTINSSFALNNKKQQLCFPLIDRKQFLNPHCPIS